MRGYSWSKEEEDKLKEFIQSGMTYLQISVILNKTKNSVLGKANRLHLKYLAVKTKPAKPRAKERVLKSEPYVPPVLKNEPVSLKLKVLDLEKHNCRFIAGEDRTFCGHEKLENSSYCDYHHDICHNFTPPLTLKY